MRPCEAQFRLIELSRQLAVFSRHSSVTNVFLCNLLQPFGKRSGSKADNRVLYPNTMLAMARVVKPVTGKAVILTYDKTSMFKVSCGAHTLSPDSQGFDLLDSNNYVICSR